MQETTSSKCISWLTARELITASYHCYWTHLGTGLMVESPQPVGSSLGPSPGIFSCPGRYLVRRCSCVITTPCAYLTGCSNQWQPYNGWCASNERFQELQKTRLKMIFASNRCQNHHIWGMGMVVLSPLKVHCELYHSHLIGWCRFFFILASIFDMCFRSGKTMLHDFFKFVEP